MTSSDRPDGDPIDTGVRKPDLCKPDLRAAALARRDAIATEARHEAAAVLAALASTLGPVAGRTVAGFWPIRSEIDPRPLMRALAGRGARLALPCVVGPGAPLVFRAFAFDGTPLVPRSFGLLEPGPEASPVTPDIVLVPLAAFDALGHRIGYGAGHYDATLAQLRGTRAIRAIGVAYACQEVMRVPDEPHDARLDAILTERGYVPLTEA